MTPSKKKIDFWIIGTQKAGTTSLYNYLAQHPEICTAKVKELHYFVEDRFYNQGEKYLNSFFDKCTDKKIMGAAYVHMLPSGFCAKRVFDYNPHTKLLVVLRDPVARAYSAYQYAIRNAWENPKNTFLKTLELENKRLNGNFVERYELAYFHNGLYAKHLAHWMEYFPKEQFIFVKDAELAADVQGTVKKVLKKLHVSEDVALNTSVKFNQAGVPKSAIINKLLLPFNTADGFWARNLGGMIPQPVKNYIRTQILPALFRFNTIEKKYPPLSEEDKKAVQGYFQHDLQLLEKEWEVVL